MLILGIWFGASLLLGAVWALVGIALGGRRSDPQLMVKSDDEDEVEAA